jgi:thioredoxin-like negative regulator of GroEL
VTYPDPEVADYVTKHCIPIKLMVPHHPDIAARYRVRWTPTIAIFGPEGTEHHRVVGYLPPRDFLAQVALARAKAAFDAGDFTAAAPLFADVVQRYPETHAAPEAQYWCGVAQYKAAGDAAQLRSAWQTLRQHYPQSEWAKKASFLFE